MAPGKHARQTPARVPSAEGLAQPAQRHFVFHAIFKPTGICAIRAKQVSMFPLFERSGNHDVAKHSSRLTGRVLRNPDLRDRPDAQFNFYTGTDVLDAAILLINRGGFPRRSELRQRVRLSVEPVHLLRGSRHAAAAHKHFAHVGRSPARFPPRRREIAYRSEMVAAPLLKLANPPECKYSLALPSCFRYASQKASDAELVYPKIS